MHQEETSLESTALYRDATLVVRSPPTIALCPSMVAATRISQPRSVHAAACSLPRQQQPIRCRVVRMPVGEEPLGRNGDDDEELQNEWVLFDNLQSQDEDPESDDGDEGLKGPLSFVLDSCPFGPGVMTVLKSMSKGEECEAWLDPKHGPGEFFVLKQTSKSLARAWHAWTKGSAPPNKDAYFTIAQDDLHSTFCAVVHMLLIVLVSSPISVESTSRPESGSNPTQ